MLLEMMGVGGEIICLHSGFKLGRIITLQTNIPEWNLNHDT